MTIKPIIIPRRSYLVGGISWLCLMAIVIFGYVRDGGKPYEFANAVAAVFFISVALVGMSAKGLKAWVLGTVGGIVVGAFSALQLFYGAKFERAFFVAVATLAFFTALGLIIGAIAEFIRFLHWAAHRAIEAGNKPARLRGGLKEDL